MQLLEWMGKELLDKYEIMVPKRVVINTGETDILSKVGNMQYPLVVKSQVPTGGRGKAGAIRMVDNANSLLYNVQKVFECEVKGFRPSMAIVEESLKLNAEYYMSIVIDFDLECPLLLLSSRGGIDVEKMSVENPESIIKIQINTFYGIMKYKVRDAALKLGATNLMARNIASVASQLYKLFMDHELILIEINPLGILADESVSALDCKVIVDESTLNRHKILKKYYTLLDPKTKSQIMKESYNLDYVELDGNIGLISGGAGMTMTAMDFIYDCGGKPACFLDCSNNATVEGYKIAMKTVLDNPKVRSVLINIFGGLTQMDKVADALTKVMDNNKHSKIPVVIRIEGTNSEKGRNILTQHGLKVENNFKNAVEKVVYGG